MKAISNESLVTLAMIFSLAACGNSPKPSTDGILVGALLPFTGDQASSGANLEKGLLWVVEQVNSAGGIRGKTLRIVSRDTHSDPRRGFVAAQELVNTVGVAALIGPEEPDLAYPVARLLADRQIVGVSGSWTAPPLNAVTTNGYSIRTAPTNVAIANVLARQIVATGTVRLSIVSSDDAYGQQISSLVADQFGKLGGLIVSTVRLPAGMTNFDREIRLITDSRPDGIALLSYPKLSSIFVQAMTAATGRLRWFLSPSLKNQIFIDNIPPGSMEGAIGVAPAVASDSETFIRAFSDRWAGDVPISECLFYYDAMALVALGLQEVSSPISTPDLRSAILRVSRFPFGRNVPWYDIGSGLRQLSNGIDVNYRGASGSVDLDDNGEVAEGLVRAWQIAGESIVDGSIVVARPL